MSALFIGEFEKELLRDLARQAAAAPVDMRTLGDRLATPEGKRAHMRQMTAQSVPLPVGYLVTFSVEIGHPCGAARHLSMSTARAGKVPHPEAIWMVAAELGFWGGIEHCTCWVEELLGHGSPDENSGHAINCVQPIAPAQTMPARPQ